jgi:hypothetical protein
MILYELTLLLSSRALMTFIPGLTRDLLTQPTLFLRHPGHSYWHHLFPRHPGTVAHARVPLHIMM